MNSTRSVVAIVDDDGRMLESLGNLLESAGHDVRLYSSGKALYDEGDLSGIDCLISDVAMPEMTGVELQQWVQATRPDLPVILITGRQEIWESRTPQPDGDWYFEKPFDGQRLLAAVCLAIATGRAKDTRD